MSQTITSRDIADHVTIALEAGEGAEDFDVDGIVRELIATYGLTQNIPAEAFWSIVERHDLGAR